jgi:hypothetical protein
LSEATEFLTVENFDKPIMKAVKRSLFRAFKGVLVLLIAAIVVFLLFAGGRTI